MIEIGRLCIKTAGRDAGLKCVIVDILDNKFVLIDGETRRRKCNILHLEPLEKVVKIKKNASHEDVSNVLKDLDIMVRETKPKQKTEKPIKKRKTPEQLREQKEEKKKSRSMFGLKKKESKKEMAKENAGESLEEKAGLVDGKKEENKEKTVKQNQKKDVKKGKNSKPVKK
ncbi:MAG: 50S ribosomal protein L14e [Candidatus Woesearchaeota archaeon]